MVAKDNLGLYGMELEARGGGVSRCEVGKGGQDIRCSTDNVGQ